MSWIEVTRDADEPDARPVPDDVISSYGVRVRSSYFEGVLWLRFEHLTNGQVVVRQLRFDSDLPITSTLLAGLPLQEITAQVLRGREDDDPEYVLNLLRNVGFTDREAHLLSQAPAEGEPRRVGTAGPSWEDLELFAAEYKWASRVQPGRAISLTMQALEVKGLQISRATANRWRELCERTDPPLLLATERRRPALRPSTDDEGTRDD